MKLKFRQGDSLDAVN